MYSTYELRLYDETMICFALRDSGDLSGLQAQIIWVNESKSHLFPLDLQQDNKSLLRWLRRRVIPKNRTFVYEILQSLGLQMGDTKGILDVCKGLSLNDSYWVVPEGFTGRFDDYNLYDNPFSDTLALVAYTGFGSSQRPFTTSPELTTNGMLPKAWRRLEDGNIYLYKGATFGAANTGREPYMEYYASQIAKTMGLNAINYDLEQWKGILASKCKLFTSKDIAYYPIGHVLRDCDITQCVQYYASKGKTFSQQLNSMLIFDAVIFNEDRHFGNFGLLRNNHTGEIIAPAPIFDNGMSLLHFAMPADLENLAAYAKTRTNPYEVSLSAICNTALGKEQMAQVRKLIGFRFERHPTYNLPESFLQPLENYLQVRVREILELGAKQRRRNTQER